MIDIATPQSLVAEGLEAIRAEVVEAEIFAAGSEPLIACLNYTSDMPCHGVQETNEKPKLENYHDPKVMELADETLADRGWSALVTFRGAGWLSSLGFLADHYTAKKLETNVRSFRPRNGFRFGGEGTGLYIGRIWYTYPINRLGPGDFTCTVVGDSYLIEHGKLGQPLKPNSIRINDNFIQLFQNVIGVTRDKKPTLVWSAAETVIAPELAVRQLHVENIAESMG